MHSTILFFQWCFKSTPFSLSSERFSTTSAAVVGQRSSRSILSFVAREGEFTSQIFSAEVRSGFELYCLITHYNLPNLGSKIYVELKLNVAEGYPQHLRNGEEFSVTPSKPHGCIPHFSRES